MTRFTIDITDPDQLAGITSAREAHNASLPEVLDDSNPPVPIDPKPGTLETDDEYVQFVMDYASQSYAKTYAPAVVAAQEDLKQAQTQLDAKFAVAEVAEK